VLVVAVLAGRLLVLVVVLVAAGAVVLAGVAGAGV